MAWSDISTRIDNELALEGNSIANALKYTLANEALDIISEKCRPMRKQWLIANLAATTTPATGSYYLPSDMVGPIQAVMYDGEILPRVGPERFEMLDADGEDEYYTTSGSILRIRVSDLTLVKIEAYQSLPHFNSITPPNPDPMTYLPGIAAMLPAYYVLTQFAVAPDVPREQQRLQRFAQLWTEGLTAALNAIASRQLEQWRY